MAASQDILVVVHTANELEPNLVAVRIISARKPSRRELRGYQEGIMSSNENDMRDEYDFSEGQRGKFHRPGMTLTLPLRVRLGQSSVSFLAAEAAKNGVSPEDFASSILETQLARMRSLGS